MINILKNSLELGKLPFELVDDLRFDGDEERWHDFSNPLVGSRGDRRQFIESEEQDRTFGPPGTIGLHVRVASSFSLKERAVHRSSLREDDAMVRLLVPGSLPHLFLAEGQFERATRLRIRICAPIDRYFPSQVGRLVDLVFDDGKTIRFECPGLSRSRQYTYTATCTRAFWPGCAPEDTGELIVAEFDLDDEGSIVDFRYPDGACSLDQREWFCRVATRRICELLDVALNGLFWLGAVRGIQPPSVPDEVTFKEPRIMRSRYVGGAGEFAHSVARRFAFNEMRSAEGQAPASINYRFSVAGPDVRNQLLSCLDDPPGPSPVLRIWESASERSKQGVIRIEPVWDITLRDQVTTAQLLNDALQRRDLYDPTLWHDLDAEACALIRKGITALTDHEVEWLNRRLIEAAFPPRIVRRHPGFVFDTFYSVWLERLLGTRCLYVNSHASPADDWSGDQAPSGFLLKYVPDDERSLLYETPEERRDLNRLMNPPFKSTGIAAAPVNMSSGFHQVAPIIIQAGVMRANEVLCIENPEGHLHPKLQLDIADFILQQSRIGKFMIVETHSDLIVRRVMRAVMAEELKQEALRLYFSRVDVESELFHEHGVASSALDRVEIDERGQIRNWPEGFMDADIRESRRLMDIMYGSPLENIEEDEEESS